MKRNVCIIGNSINVKGGISSVIKQTLEYDWLSDGINMIYLPVYYDKGILLNILLYFKSIFKLFSILIRGKVDIFHIHMSYRGSFVRKYIIFNVIRIFRKKLAYLTVKLI